MTRNLKKIAQALAAKGYTMDAEEARWEPLTGPYEMSGYDGGWYIPFEPCTPLGDYDVFGYNIAEVMEMIAKLPALDSQTP